MFSHPPHPCLVPVGFRRVVREIRARSPSPGANSTRCRPLSGQITVETAESRLLSSAGELTFVPQGMSYRTEILENAAFTQFIFTTVDSYPKLAPAVITPPYPVALRNLFAGLHARYRVGLEHDLTCLSMFYEILAETARALPTPGRRPAAARPSCARSRRRSTVASTTPN